MITEAISGCLESVKHAIVPNYADNAQAVVAKHARTSRRLRDAVRFECSPLFYSCLISEERQRQDLSGFRQTLEALYGYEPFNLVQERPKCCRDLEVFLLLALSRPDLKNDSDHVDLLPLFYRRRRGVRFCQIRTASFRTSSICLFGDRA